MAPSPEPRKHAPSGGGPWGTISAPNPYAPPSIESQRQPQVLLGPDQLVLAELGPRLLARVIDLVLVGLAVTPGVVLFETWDEDLGALLLLVGWLAIRVTQWVLISIHGQTLGKRWLGLRIVTSKGQPVGFARGVLLREWVMRCGSAILWGFPLLLDPLFVFARTRQTLHDHLADTLVIVVGTPGDPGIR